MIYSPEIDSKKKRTSTNSPVSSPKSDEPKENGSGNETPSSDEPKGNGSKSLPSTGIETPSSDKKPIKKETTKKTPTAKKTTKKATPKSSKTTKKTTAADSPDSNEEIPLPDIKKESTNTNGNTSEHSSDDKEIKTKDEPASKSKQMNAFFTRKSDDKDKNSQAGIDYNPGKKNYHPINDAFWKHGER